jgi:hypothetical protein
MRSHMFALLIAVVGLSSLVGCGGGSSSHDQGVADMTAGADGAMPAAGSCNKMLICASGCSTTACQQQCEAAGTTAAQGYFTALFTCAYAPCLASDNGNGPDDGGLVLCSSMSDVSSTCRSCVTQEAEGPGCATQLSNCETH